MPSEHANLSPSSSERWINCPASIKAVEDAGLADEVDSFFAMEGTMAHEIAEIEASYHFGRIAVGPYLQRKTAWRAACDASPYEFDRPTMEQHAKDYVVFLREAADQYPHAQVFLEQRMNTGIPDCWGTSDTVIVSPSHVHIIDYKYGSGLRVKAWNNTQLMCYGVGALETFGDLLGDTENVTLGVYQPRMDNTSSWTLPASDLRAWRDSIIPVAVEALAGSDRFGPSAEVCRWCPIAGQCRARMEYVTQEDFGRDPALITPEEMGELLQRVPDIKAWLTALEAAALDNAYAKGIEIPGWKVVKSGGRRVITDPTAAIQTFIDMGFPAEKVAQFKVKSFEELEKLLKPQKKTLDSVLGPLLRKSEGRESLVPDHDSRPAITHGSDAAADFA